MKEIVWFVLACVHFCSVAALYFCLTVETIETSDICGIKEEFPEDIIGVTACVETTQQDLNWDCLHGFPNLKVVVCKETDNITCHGTLPSTVEVRCLCQNGLNDSSSSMRIGNDTLSELDEQEMSPDHQKESQADNHEQKEPRHLPEGENERVPNDINLAAPGGQNENTTAVHNTSSSGETGQVYFDPLSVSSILGFWVLVSGMIFCVTVAGVNYTSFPGDAMDPVIDAQPVPAVAVGNRPNGHIPYQA